MPPNFCKELKISFHNWLCYIKGRVLKTSQQAITVLGRIGMNVYFLQRQ